MVFIDSNMLFVLGSNLVYLISIHWKGYGFIGLNLRLDAPGQVLLLLGHYERRELVPAAPDGQHRRLRRRSGRRVRAAPHVRPLPVGVRQAQ